MARKKSQSGDDEKPARAPRPRGSRTTGADDADPKPAAPRRASRAASGADDTERKPAGRRTSRGAAGAKDAGQKPAARRASRGTAGAKDAGRKPAGRRASRDAADTAGAEDLDIASVYACVEMAVPPELQGEAIVAAIEERPDNVTMPFGEPGLAAAAAGFGAPGMAVFTKKLWKPGRTLRVRFLDNPPARVREQIEKYAHAWEQYANIKFSFGNDPNAEIRITCTLGLGSWSYLGTDALTIPRNKPTMNYGWFNEQTPDEEFSRTVLHEFGHALGCIHEHMSPAGDIPWNRPAAYRYYMSTQGWTKQEVDSQLFAKYGVSQLNTTEYDPRSIMHYPVPKALTTGGFEVGWNRTLSNADKAFIRKVYS
ncbi:MAG TPA: M12 family metallopeptidase [Longimicrobium sp.]|nr:M12 family metallopeptidase [Longimicrobium sp.]